MSSIGRLPTPASAGVASTIEDDELELLSLQLSTTACASKGLEGGRFAPAVTSNSQFYTHPRKRHKQKSLMTLWSDRQLLDEIQSEGIKRLLTRVQHQWDFSAFSLDRLSNGSNLPTLCTYLFQNHNLVSHFRLDTLTTWKFFSLVERGYHSRNPYHNSAHAADVTQAMACFIVEPMIIKYLKPIEIMAALIAAVCHDIDHPGLNEKFLIATSSHLAGLYENSSVLENHHWKSALSILWESGFAQMMTKEDRLEMEEIMKELILATDISRQPEFLSLLKQYQDNGEMDLSLKKYRLFVLQIAVKCADISNPCRSWNISRLWSYRACEEFFRQGDRERELGLPITQICDRQNISIAKVQSGFYRFIAAPLFEEWNRFLSSSLSRQMLNNLTSNQARWDLIIQQETARSASMAESVASQISSSSSSGGGSMVAGSSSRRESLDPHVSNQRLSRSSMEGDDDSDPCASYSYTQFEANIPYKGPLAAAMCSRRHSLPVQTEAFERLFNSNSNTSNVDEEIPSILQPGSSVPRPLSSVPSQSPMVGPQFIRQYSFGERRRSLKQPQSVSSDNNYTAGAIRAIAANRRRLFAGSRSPMISAVESLSSSESSNSGSLGVGSIDKSADSSFDQDVILTSNNNDSSISNLRLGKQTSLDSCGGKFVNMNTTQVLDANIKSNANLSVAIKTNLNTDTSNVNQHRSVTFQVSGSSESSENSKDDFLFDLEQCKNLVNRNLHRNLNDNEHIVSSRRGSAPCNLLLNQIHANKLVLAASSLSCDNAEKIPITTENENHFYNVDNEIDDNDNVANSNRRGSLPVHLNYFIAPITNNSLTNDNGVFDSWIQENKNGTNREYRLNYAEKRRQMAHRKKLLAKNHSLDVGIIPSSMTNKAPMLSQCNSIRSSSFGGVGENLNNNANNLPMNSAYLDNYTSSNPDCNSESIHTNESLARILMYRRGSAPIHRQASFSSTRREEKCNSLYLSDDVADRNNLNVPNGLLKDKILNDQNHSAAHSQNHNSTPSLSTLLAREHINAVQSRIQLLQNHSPGYYSNVNMEGYSKANVHSANNPHALLNDVVNNCINNENGSSLIDGSMSTTNNNSANIRRGSLPTDFHFYNSFGVC